MEQASANEGLFARLLHLQADLATADSLQDMLNRLQRWARGFGLAGATVRLFAERWKIGAPSDFTHLALTRSAFEPFRIQRLGSEQHYLGGLNGPNCCCCCRRPNRLARLARWRCRCWATTANWAW